MIYRTDYHIHTTYSDGRDTPEAYVVAAIKEGLKEIGFSEHIALVSKKQKWVMDPAILPEYVDHISRLRRQFPEIAVRLGLELDYIPKREKEIEKIVTSFPFDYIIGSVHYLGEETVDLGPEFYSGKDINQIYESYFNLVCEAAATGFYDIIGHPDLVRIHRFSPEKDISHLYRMMASKFKAHDVAFELNTNGRNKPLNDFYPDKKQLPLFSEHGLPVCVNSDAHFPSRVGQFFDEAYELLKRSGFSEMAVFKNRERFMIPF
ncbi:MAG TPA: histidinol-phosphatase HisJ family protein [Bacteroidales bacterium]|nr:histidinol-phosphatase HisJ family protein [Bacteroidales bacterium]